MCLSLFLWKLSDTKEPLKEAQQFCNNPLLLFRTIATTKTGHGRQQLVNVRACGFNCAIAECYLHKLACLVLFQIFVPDNLCELSFFLLGNILPPFDHHVGDIIDPGNEVFYQRFFTAEFRTGIDCLLDGDQDFFIITVRIMILLDEHQDIIDIDLNLLDQFDFKHDIISDVLFFSRGSAVLPFCIIDDVKMDMVITKSISRFARNTVTLLETVRELKLIGVDVYFEEQNIHSISADGELIYTLDSKGELLITIMSSLAQEESRSISENVTWGQRKRFADGKVSMPYRHFLGYRKGADDLPEIVPEEAELVRRIYRMFMQGKTPHAIGKILTAEGIPTPAGKEKWQSSTIESILQNEKYRGDARLQKKFTVDFLQKKMKINEGEVPQYYVENSHPAIIDPEEWDLVQAEFSRRKALGSRYSAATVFSSMIFCGDCGSVYGSKVWHSTDKYRRIIWQCNDKFKGNHHCTTPHLYEKDIKALFLRAFGKLMADREHILEDIQLVQAALCDCTELDTQQAT